MASTDGKVVNQHFGRADRFYIVEFCEKTHTLHLLEERRLAPVCRGGDHEEKSLREQAEQLADCRYVLVSRIGRRAETELERRGIQVFEIPGVIEEAVEKLWSCLEIQKLLSIMSCPGGQDKERRVGKCQS